MAFTAQNAPQTTVDIKLNIGALPSVGSVSGGKSYLPAHGRKDTPDKTPNWGVIN